MKAYLSDGFETEIEENALGDWEFLELLEDIEKGGGSIVEAARRLLGRDGVNALKEHLRGKDGRVLIEDMANAMTELMESASATKN